LTFEDAQRGLLAQVRDRIRNGELTERGFARLIGISQPHVHNVLKGVRNLSPQVCDAILNFFHMSILDLVSLEELNAYLRRRIEERFPEVPILESPIGPGRPWPRGFSRQRRFLLPFASVAVPGELVMTNLVSDPQMLQTLSDYDIALLDTSPAQTSEVTPEGLYVVDRGEEAVLRHMRRGAHVYYIVSDASMSAPEAWERRELTGGFVKARVRWLGRARDRELPASQRGRFLYDVISS